MSAKKSIVVQAMIIHEILKEQDQKHMTPPVIRSNLHPNDDKVIKLIDFLDNLLEKNGLAHSHASTFDQTTTASKIINDFLFNKVSLPVEDDETETNIKSESADQTQYRRISNKLTHALNYHVYQSTKTKGDHLPANLSMRCDRFKCTMVVN